MKSMNNIANNLIRTLEYYTRTIIRTFLHDEPKRVPIKVVNGHISRESPYHTTRL